MNKTSFKIVPGMMGNLTSYDIEYVAYFLGEKRINAKQIELENKPTIGIPFDDFLSSRSMSYGTGIFYLFSMLLQYFPDVDLAEYLFHKSSLYTKENYYDGPNMKIHWQEVQGYQDRCLKNGKEASEFQIKKTKNQYWLEYHFFITTVVQILYKPLTKPINIELLNQIFGFYFNHLADISAEINDSWMGGQPLRNAILKTMSTFIKKQGDKEKAQEILQYAIELGWRV